MSRSALPIFIVMLVGNAQAEGLPDPTRPPAGFESAVEAAKSDADTLPRLTGIKIGRGTRTAILNGMVLGRNDVVGGYEVVSIEPGRVKLSRNGSEVVIPLLPDVKKKKHKGR